MTQPASLEPRFLYVGGDPALDLINTVDWTSRGLDNERLEDFQQLTRWAEGAGVIDGATGRRLRRLGEARPRVAAAALTYAIEARGTLRELFGAIARGEPAEPELARFNRLQREALAGLEIAPVGRVRDRLPLALAGRGVRSPDPGVAGALVGREPAPVGRGRSGAGVRRRRLRLDVRGPEPQRVPPLVSDADLRDPGEDAPPAGERLRDLTSPSNRDHIRWRMPNKPRRSEAVRSVPRTILFVDPPAFCTTVESLVAPDLRTRPVAVAPPGAERAVVLALSTEARRRGSRKAWWCVRR